MSEEQRRAFDRLSGQLRLGEEIRATRYLIVNLVKDLEMNKIAISQAMAVVCRCVSIQLRAGTDASEVEALLLEMANAALDDAERKGED